MKSGAPPYNNGMHPTPFHAASHASCVGAQVMPGVRRLILCVHQQGRMTFDYAHLVANLSEEGRIRFYELLANNLTVNVRSIWSDVNLSDAQKLSA